MDSIQICKNSIIKNFDKHLKDSIEYFRNIHGDEHHDFFIKNKELMGAMNYCGNLDKITFLDQVDNVFRFSNYDDNFVREEIVLASGFHVYLPFRLTGKVYLNDAGTPYRVEYISNCYYTHLPEFISSDGVLEPVVTTTVDI